MEKYIYNDRNGLWYELQGDYYIPCLELPAEKEDRHIGIWGQRHLRYIRQHKKVFYTTLLTSGKLYGYLADLDKQAENMFFRLVKQLKADNQMKWVARMNNIRSRATEIVNHDMIYS